MEILGVEILLCEWDWLYLATSRVLQHHSAGRLTLSAKYRPLVLKDLQSNMDHLGTEKVFDLTREGFYWPRVHTQITEYVTQVCTWLKDRAPNIYTRAPLQNSASTMLLELISIEFLNVQSSIC